MPDSFPVPLCSQAPEPVSTAPPAPPAEPEDPKAALEKQIRNLKKKLRQCSELAEKKAGGAALDKDQEDKLIRTEAW